MKRLWHNFKNFCSDNPFGTTMVAIALAGFIVTGIVLVAFPPALPAITGFAIGGFKLFGFLSSLPLLGTVPAAASATFAAMCAGTFLVGTGLLRGIAELFGLAAKSAKEDKYERNLAFMNANPLKPVDLNGNPVDPELVPFLAAGDTEEEARRKIELNNYENLDVRQKAAIQKLCNLDAKGFRSIEKKLNKSVEPAKRDEHHENPIDRKGKRNQKKRDEERLEQQSSHEEASQPAL